jgi:hypothetical protein
MEVYSIVRYWLAAVWRRKAKTLRAPETLPCRLPNG